MTNVRAGIFALAAALLLPSNARTQELEIFTLDDFISPSDLKGDDHDLWFVAARGLVGFDHHYTRRNDVLGEDVGFARVLFNLYRSGWQLNVNATRFSVDPSELRERYAPTRVGLPIGTNFDALPISRFGLETSRYLGDEDYLSARVRFKWNRENLMSSDHQDEYGVDIELKVPDAFEIAFVGGAQYLFRPLQNQHLFSLGYRQTVWHSSNGSSLLLGEGLGGEVTNGNLRFGLFRFQAGLIIKIPRVGSYIHLVGSAGGLPPGQELRPIQTSHGTLEGGVFLNVPLFAKLSSPGGAGR